MNYLQVTLMPRHSVESQKSRPTRNLCDVVSLLEKCHRAGQLDMLEKPSKASKIHIFPGFFLKI